MYKIDMHVHTAEISPCGRVKAVEAVRLYKKAGYDCIVITDHYFDGYFEPMKELDWEHKIDKYLEGYRSALNEGNSVGLGVILGMEIRFRYSSNDYLVYGIDEEFLKKNQQLYNIGLDGFNELIRDKGIMIYQAHPYRPGMTQASEAMLDGIEVHNGNPRHNSHNDKALLHAREYGLKMVSGSDFHQVDDLARGGIITLQKPADSKELVEILKNNEIVELIGNLPADSIIIA